MSDLSIIKKQVKQYLESADEQTLKIVHRILEASEDLDDPLINMTAEQEASFLRGLLNADKGKVTSHEGVMTQLRR